MTRFYRSILFRSLVLAAGVAGCNSILDNKSGTAEPVQATPSVETNQPAQTVDSGAETVATPTPVTAAGCATGTIQCNGQCVATNDPNYGCGNAACTPCSITHGTATCSAGACAVGTCDKGYSDCNNKAADGCEVDLSKSTSCGSCNAVCPTANPVCAPAGDSFQCGTGCGAGQLLCGTECATTTSTTNCGTCGNACIAPANGTSTCTAPGLCGFTCAPGFNACRGACTVATDATACGPTCAICTTPPNATPTCAADTCSFACSPNYGDCNGTPIDGCEAPFLTDPLNCGKCGNPCTATQTCTNGACVDASDGGAAVPPPVGP